MALNTVDLPAPFGPITVVIEPAGAEKLVPLRNCRRPDLQRPGWIGAWRDPCFAGSDIAITSRKGSFYQSRFKMTPAK